MNGRLVCLEDLREVWRQLSPSPAPAPDSQSVEGLTTPWIAVLGANGGVGATTVALGLAEQLPHPRLIECRTSPLSTLAAATSTELGRSECGWRLGVREGGPNAVMIQRAPQSVTASGQLPPPEAAGPLEDATILDVGWSFNQLDGWLAAAVFDADAIVVATSATCSGVVHLEAALHDLAAHTDSPIVAAVRGSHPRRWRGPLRAALGARTQRLLTREAVIAVGEDRGLRLLGLTPDPLPVAVRTAGAELARYLAPGLARGTADRHQLIPLQRTPS